uniref:chemotaxis-specific protein-glutamate methyltransferase CheB n=1 Tax=Cellvibrio fontiphilus TaxID=1815559 RepID=UPI002B4BECBB|nr:chemotaxis-specific protein-glutamate methyltransferase CheB [Cellvibrio fontiphilus]
MSTKVLIVDDSALMRKKIAELINARGNFAIEFARNGIEAINLNQRFQPDVITLDINMPEMDGLTALAQIMVERPVPVVMVSSLTEKGALATFEALALGAVDFIPKPDGTISLSIEKIGDELIEKLTAATRAKISQVAKPNRLASNRSDSTAPRTTRVIPSNFVTSTSSHAATAKHKVIAPRSSDETPEGLVLIGVSTGGPGTLEIILRNLSDDFPFPILVAQHMPAAFTGPFAQRMNSICPLHVVEVAQPTPIKKGGVYIGRGGGDMVITTRAGNLYALPKPESPLYRWHPSVELLGRSALEHCNAEHLIGVMLTGMGNDGADAFNEIYRQGGRTIAESEESAVVFGMPKELIDCGGASIVLPATKIAQQLCEWAAPDEGNYGIRQTSSN